MSSSGNGHRPAIVSKVLVPLDGSPLAEEALPVAVRLARGAGAALHLVLVQGPAPVAVPFGFGQTPVGDEREIGERLRHYLVSTAEGLTAKYGLPVTWAVEHGEPAEEIAAIVRAQRVSLVVMTTHGRGGLSRLWLGSVADELLRRVTAPVLLLRPGEHSFMAGSQRIVVGLDGSEQAERTLETAIALGALAPQASFLLALVIEPPQTVVLPMEAPLYAPPDWPEAQRSRATDYLTGLARRLGERGLEVSTCVRIGPDVASQLADLARESRATVIALATRGARGVERLLLGSVTDKVIRIAEQPVLVVPPLATGAGSTLRPGARAMKVERR